MIYFKEFRDLGYVAVANPDDWRVEYSIYIIEAEAEDGTLLFHRAYSDSWPDPVEALNEAEAFICGAVKWDGSSEWSFTEIDSAGDRADLLDLGEVLARCWDWASELLEHWDGERG